MRLFISKGRLSEMGDYMRWAIVRDRRLFEIGNYMRRLSDRRDYMRDEII